MNPFIDLKLDNEEALKATHQAASRFVKSGLSDLAYWIALDVDVQDAIIAARDLEKLIHAQSMAAIALNPSVAMAEFSRPLDGGEFAHRLESAIMRSDFQEENPGATVVNLADLAPDQAAELGVTIDT